MKSTIPQLLKIAVNDEDERVRAAGVDILQTLRKPQDRSSKLGRYMCRPLSTSFLEDFGDAILLAIPSAIALVTPEGRDIQNAIDALKRPFFKLRTLSHARTSL